ncbi:Pycsar system effector family protein [Chitinophaga sp.]|uniref:Pycsar system effector family protein n=1 Tax=Chitinophaga sp. TaxID=1869181 RepID=UPI0031DB2144
MQTSVIIDAAQQYVTAQYQDHPHPNLVYHNLEHTRQVVAAAAQISAHYRLQDTDLLVVYIAAWFHDLGYLLGESKTHEETGASLACNFLNEQKVPLNIQEQVTGCIMATKMPQEPHNLLEEIVCDADLFNFGTKEFKKRTKVLHEEIELTHGTEISGATWTEGTLRLLTEHHYHTAYCQALLQEQKEENIAWLKKRLEKQEEKAERKAEKQDDKKEEKTEEKEKNKIKVDKPEKKNKEPKAGRGVETMFRTTSSNHIRLSAMADSKAHIMISVNSIIVSVILGVLFRKLEDYPNLVIPSILFLTTGVVTIIFSVLATRPNVNKGQFTREDIANKKTNLLFFGNFHEMQLDQYAWGMTEMMKDSDYLYGSMIQDIYHLGVVLGKKYKQLRIAYNIFMFGLIISVLAFVIAVLFFPVNN